jgi:hypothetical protein
MIITGLWSAARPTIGTLGAAQLITIKPSDSPEAAKHFNDQR